MADNDDILRIIHEIVKDSAKDISAIKIDQAAMKVDIAHHIKRSDANEANIKHLDEGKVQPMEQKMAKLSGMYQLVVFLSVLSGIALVFVEFFKK